jgi:hypothetical protein
MFCLELQFLITRPEKVSADRRLAILNSRLFSNATILHPWTRCPDHKRSLGIIHFMWSNPGGTGSPFAIWAEKQNISTGLPYSMLTYYREIMVRECRVGARGRECLHQRIIACQWKSQGEERPFWASFRQL